MNAAHSEEIANNSLLPFTDIYRDIIRSTQYWPNTVLLE